MRPFFKSGIRQKTPDKDPSVQYKLIIYRQIDSLLTNYRHIRAYTINKNNQLQMVYTKTINDSMHCRSAMKANASLLKRQV